MQPRPWFQDAVRVSLASALRELRMRLRLRSFSAGVMAEKWLLAEQKKSGRRQSGAHMHDEAMSGGAGWGGMV